MGRVRSPYVRSRVRWYRRLLLDPAALRYWLAVAALGIVLAVVVASALGRAAAARARWGDTKGPAPHTIDKREELTIEKDAGARQGLGQHGDGGIRRPQPAHLDPESKGNGEAHGDLFRPPVRVAARQMKAGDEAAEKAFSRLLELRPDDTLAGFHHRRLALGQRGADIRLSEK